MSNILEKGGIVHTYDSGYDRTISQIKEAEEMYGDMTVAEKFGYVSRR